MEHEERQSLKSEMSCTFALGRPGDVEEGNGVSCRDSRVEAGANHAAEVSVGSERTRSPGASVSSDLPSAGVDDSGREAQQDSTEGDGDGDGDADADGREQEREGKGNGEGEKEDATEKEVVARPGAPLERLPEDLMDCFDDIPLSARSWRGCDEIRFEANE